MRLLEITSDPWGRLPRIEVESKHPPFLHVHLRTHDEGAIHDVWGRVVGYRRPKPAPERVKTAGDTVGALFVTPVDVLRYRKIWDPFVMGTIRAMRMCANAWENYSQSQTPETRVDLSRFAQAPSAETIHLFANSMEQDAMLLLDRWNAHQDEPDWRIMTNARDILRDFQMTVRKAAAQHEDIRKNCPDLPLPSPPSLDLQTEVISELEGLGVITRGVLDLLWIGTKGSLEVAERAGSLTSRAVETVTTPWLVGLAIVAVVAAIALTRLK